MEKLRTGVAYHGNRILRHVEEDMTDICRHGMNLVVHMLSPNDWDRHLGVMKDMVAISESCGLEVWIDNWGIGGPPGDKSHFLQYHPQAHQVYSDGSIDPVSACYNSEDFVQFTKDWLDAVREFGGKTVFWDEPRLKEKGTGHSAEFTCRCDACQRLFEEQYGEPMPHTMTPELEKFRHWTLTHYFDRVTAYAKLLGMENVACVMLRTLAYTEGLRQLPHLDNFGIDPYWHPENPARYREPYRYVYTYTKEILAEVEKCGKQSHVWIQGYNIPAGYEDELISATDAAYDAGAKTILYWSYRGGEPNTYRSDHCERVWQVIGEATQRIRFRHFDRLREERQAELRLSE